MLKLLIVFILIAGCIGFVWAVNLLKTSAADDGDKNNPPGSREGDNNPELSKEK